MKKDYSPKNLNQAMFKLAEELGELSAAVGKTGRWGPESINPELKKGDPFFEETNWDWMLREYEDVLEAFDWVTHYMDSYFKS